MKLTDSEEFKTSYCISDFCKSIKLARKSKLQYFTKLQ